MSALACGIRDHDVFGHQSSQQRGSSQERLETDWAESLTSPKFFEQPFTSIWIVGQVGHQHRTFSFKIGGIDDDVCPGRGAGQCHIENVFLHNATANRLQQLWFDLRDGDPLPLDHGNRS